MEILLADDHPVVRRGLRQSLEERAGWQVCAEAENGREAVELAERHRPAVAILDLSMPQLNGIEATRLIRARVPQTEVLIFSLHHAEELAAQAMAAGARGYLSKSDGPGDLLDAVDALSRHAPWFSGRVGGAMVSRIVRGSGNRGGSLTLLTGREREIVKLVAEGARTREIATRLGISEKTVETHRSAIMRKLNLKTVATLVRFAVRNQLIQA
jgi:DNA-binding NarL/FixJ family response regulator